MSPLNSTLLDLAVKRATAIYKQNIAQITTSSDPACGGNGNVFYLNAPEDPHL